MVLLLWYISGEPKNTFYVVFILLKEKKRKI
jgi:hypothetical protein